jgi:hypothetical protein
MLKLIYLAKRKPGFTFDQFVRRWRMHGARGMEQSLWEKALGYVQAEPILPPPFASASSEYDAVASFILRDDAFDVPPIREEGAAMAADELETFAGPIAMVSLWVREERLVEGGLGGHTAFLFFADPVAARRTAERAATAGDRLRRLVVNLRSDDGPFGPGANTLPYDAVVEVAAEDQATLKSVVEGDGSSLLADADIAVVTREAVLWDRLSA